MAALLTDKGTVYPRHRGEPGHMNVIWYVGKRERGTSSCLRISA